MSLDVYLEDGAATEKGSGIFIRENGSMREISRVEWDEKFPGREPVVADVESRQWYSGNITHNLAKMADAAGIYKALWRPEEVGVTRAYQLIEPLTAGLERLESDPAKYREFNPPNGWGSYEGLISFIKQYLAACQANPTCAVRVWR